MSLGDSMVFTVPVVVTDNYGDSDTLQITITLRGTNDAPVADADIAVVIDEDEFTVHGKHRGVQPEGRVFFHLFILLSQKIPQRTFWDFPF